MNFNQSKSVQSSSYAVVALGSNLGDVKKNLRDAVNALEAIPSSRVLKVSSIIETLPVGGPSDQPVFSNGAALLETKLSPVDLLHELQRIELELKRKRLVFWGPRTIDLDLIAYDDVEMETKELTLPHPRVYWRHFVLDPVCEIAPEFVIPTSGLSFEETRLLLYWNFASFDLFSALLQKSTNSRAF